MEINCVTLNYAHKPTKNGDCTSLNQVKNAETYRKSTGMKTDTLRKHGREAAKECHRATHRKPQPRAGR